MKKISITLLALLTINFASADCFFVFDTDLVFKSDFEVCNKQFYYEQIASDVVVTGVNDHIILQKSVTVDNPSKLLIISDGRFFPIDGPSGFVRIKINNDDQYSSFAILDWSTGITGRSGQHSFNVIAYREVPAGTYSIQLVASAHPSNNGSFTVGSLSGMSIMLDPELKVIESSLTGESIDIDVTTYDPPDIDILEGSVDRPYVEILDNDITNTISQSANVLNFVSGRAFKTCSSGSVGRSGQGDAMWGFWSDNMCQYTSEASWGVNDLYQGAELEAPMYAHSIYSLSHLQELNIKFGATELAFGSDRGGDRNGAFENNVCYKVGNAKLLSLLNGNISGGLGGNSTFCSTYTWKCVATTIGQPGCPNANTDVTLASGVINIPVNHSGILFFSAKTRIQAGSAEDAGMVVRLGIKIDGIKVGSIGIQRIFRPGIDSSRSLTASYLSAIGDNSTPLSAGEHTIEAYINVTTTSAKFPSVPEELVLTYFDFD